MIFQLQSDHGDAIAQRHCAMCLHKRGVRAGKECICFRVAGKVLTSGIIDMETFLVCLQCYGMSMSDYFDFADDGIWKNTYFQFKDCKDNMLYQFDDRFRCIP